MAIILNSYWCILRFFSLSSISNYNNHFLNIHIHVAVRLIFMIYCKCAKLIRKCFHIGLTKHCFPLWLVFLTSVRILTNNLDVTWNIIALFMLSYFCSCRYLYLRLFLVRLICYVLSDCEHLSCRALYISHIAIKLAQVLTLQRY